MIANLLMHGVMQLQGLGPWRALRRAAENPQATQDNVLRDILRANRATEYGCLHDFAWISGYEDFARTVPIVDYEALRPFIETQLRTGEPALTTDPPLMYARTSGTTGEPKYVPLVKAEMRGQKRHMALLTYLLYDFDPRAFAGKLWAMASAAEEGKFDSGVPFGSASGFLYAHMGRVVSAKYLIPAEVFGVRDSELKYRTILRLALAEENITYLNAPNPTTLNRLCALANEFGLGLADDIEAGKFDGEANLPPEAARAVRKRLKADPARARALRKIFAQPGKADFAALWPNLRLVSTWTGGNCGVATAALRPLLPAVARVVELGYLSSEFRGSLTVDCETGAGLPTLQDNFFEFIEPERWDAGSRDCRLLHELEPGRDYYVIATTPSGLYRYFINDIVRVVARFRNTPTMLFMQKGKGVTNITGEKLYESHVVEALGKARERFGVQTFFYLMLADVECQRYRLYLEFDGLRQGVDDFAHAIDCMLSELNEEYLEKRRSGRLNPLEVRVLKGGAGEAYRAHCIQRGQNEGQFKTVTLQYAHVCDFPLQSFEHER